MIIAEDGEIVTVTDFYFDNDLGGTVIDKGFRARVQIDRQFYDEECGQRFVGHLVDEEDVAKTKKVGTTGFADKEKPQKYNDPNWVWNPAKVYFDDGHIARDAK